MCASAQGLRAQAWNDTRTRALVEHATQRRARQLADTALADYKATAHGYLTFLAQFGEGFAEPPKIVKADELGLEVYWKAPDMSKQRIMGRRDTLLLPTDISYHRDHLGIIQNNFPGIIRLGDGDEVRDVPHPLSAAGLVAYDFAVRDSLEIHLSDRTLNVYEVRVRPKNDREPRAVGAVYIDRESAEVVRMAFSFTRAALRDKSLEDVSVVLENGLIEGRFWLPRRQEIEIRRSGTWLDYPARGIIRGRWEICCYEINRGFQAAYFKGPEIVVATPAERKAFTFPGRLLDSLPPDVRAVTDEDVKRVQEDARALVRNQALARTQRTTLSAARISDFVRFNRVEGLALGAGISKQAGAGLIATAKGRYGFADSRWKGSGSLGMLRGSGAGVILRGGNDFREAGDEAEASMLRNSIAAQEFGSDYTDPFAVKGVSLTALSGGQPWRLSASLAFERQGSVSVHARPVVGHFEPVIPALSLIERSVALSLSRQTALAWEGFEGSGALTLKGASFTAKTGPARGTFIRPAFRANLERPFGNRRLVLHTLAAGVFSSDTVPPQDLVFLGGPVSAPGYDFHSLVARGGFSQRVEMRMPVPFYSVPLGRYGRAPSTITLAPYANVAWTGCPAAFRPARQGWYPSVGVGALSFFDLVRIDVARGLRQGRWTFSVDIGKDFWSIL